MPRLYLSPSTQDWNLYVTGHGSEEYFMNLLADAMEPYLIASGIRFTRNAPEMMAASSIAQANAEEYDFYLALHSNASPEGRYGENRGVIAFYYPTSSGGARAAELFVEELREIYPIEQLVRSETSTSIGELRKSRFPSVLLELGFHDQLDDALWLETNIGGLAPLLVRALTRYFYIPFLEPAPVMEGNVSTEQSDLLLREYPDPDAAVLAAMPNGAPVTVYGQWQGWYVTGYEELVGYAAAAYIRT